METYELPMTDEQKNRQLFQALVDRANKGEHIDREKITNWEGFKGARRVLRATRSVCRSIEKTIRMNFDYYLGDGELFDGDRYRKLISIEKLLGVLKFYQDECDTVKKDLADFYRQVFRIVLHTEK